MFVQCVICDVSRFEETRMAPRLSGLMNDVKQVAVCSQIDEFCVKKMTDFVFKMPR